MSDSQTGERNGMNKPDTLAQINNGADSNIVTEQLVD